MKPKNLMKMKKKFHLFKGQLRSYFMVRATSFGLMVPRTSEIGETMSALVSENIDGQKVLITQASGKMIYGLARALIQTSMEYASKESGMIIFCFKG